MDFPNYYIAQNVTRDPTDGSINAIGEGFGSQMSLPEGIYTVVTPLAENISPADFTEFALDSASLTASFIELIK